jgi:hypothetical protein
MLGYLTLLGWLLVVTGALAFLFSDMHDDASLDRRRARVRRWATGVRLRRAAGIGISVLGACTIFASFVPFEDLARTVRGLLQTSDPSVATASWLAVIATLVIALALAAGGARERAMQKKRARQTAMTDAHVSLGTGDVGEARHSVGLLLNQTRALTRRRDMRRHRASYIKHFYTLIWADEFIQNLRRTWTSGRRSANESDFLSWNEGAIDESIIKLRTLLILSDDAFEDSSRIAWERFVDRKIEADRPVTLELLRREERKVLRHRPRCRSGWSRDAT